MNPKETLARHALAVPEILLPKTAHDLSRWAVIACDQYTQDKGYWERVSARVGDAPSTLRVILPEAFLEDADRAERLAAIRSSMRDYLGGGTSPSVFAPPVNGMVYLERKTAYGRTRAGLVAAIDLDAYDWKPGSKALVRATEATIVDRIPPRMEIRRGAPLESPHIMLLVNDPEHLLVGATGKRARAGAPLYSTALEPDSGSITGWEISSDEELDLVAQALARLAADNTDPDGNAFLFAVGDGNHSLATAKAVWDEYRDSARKGGKDAEESLARHPARHALVEIVNLYDEGLTFEPIHRVLFGATTDDLAAFLAKRLGGSLRAVAGQAELEAAVSAPNTTRFGFVSASGMSILDSPDPALAVARLQPVLDDFLRERAGVSIDYIHGSEEVFRLGAREGAVAILLPPVEKGSFFATIGSGGPLPRKSFSMGEASEKRYYLECRRLF